MDAHAIQPSKTPGGKDDAMERFNRNFPFPGWDCFLQGPFQSS